MTSSRTWGAFFDPCCGGWRKMAALPLPVAILGDLICGNRKWGHPRWRPEAEGPPFSSTLHNRDRKTRPILLTFYCDSPHGERKILNIEIATVSWDHVKMRWLTPSAFITFLNHITLDRLVSITMCCCNKSLKCSEIQFQSHYTRILMNL